MNKEKL